MASLKIDTLKHVFNGMSEGEQVLLFKELMVCSKLKTSYAPGDVYETYVRRELSITDAISCLALGNCGERTRILYDRTIVIGDSNLTISDGRKSYTYTISTLHNYIYAVNFIFPVLNFKMWYESTTNKYIVVDLSNESQDLQSEDITLKDQKEPVSITTIEFITPIINNPYYKLCISYSMDPRGISSNINLDEVDIRHFQTPSFVVGVVYNTQEIYQQWEDNKKGFDVLYIIRNNNIVNKGHSKVIID